MFVESDGVRLSVYERGDRSAPTVVLVHGYPDTHRVWDAVAAILAEEYHVVTYDVRGAGASGKPRDLAGYRLPVLARDLFAVVDAVSPDQPVHVVAHDWGSIQAWEAVTTPGARIASYTSISGPCLDHVGHWIRRRPTVKHLKQWLHSWYILAFHLPFLAPFVWRRVIGPRWAKVLRRLEGVQAHVPDTIVEDGVNGISLYRANFIPRLSAPRVRRTDVPVQIIQPLKDNYVTDGVLDAATPWVPNLRRRVLDAGHWAPVTHAKVVALLVTNHITAHTPSGGTPATPPAPGSAPGSTTASRPR
ncbi:alpha/beta fold hydrolase [Saccharothrix sp.]|uniref:alpha/beta fold hydrolase n=1 Tax=Saccharothrix sp. TaxID=1873460 RepID=UPI002810B3A7|nr:alpha/beta fold hydrolase [Saccharothrix sp.]